MVGMVRHEARQGRGRYLLSNTTGSVTQIGITKPKGETPPDFQMHRGTLK
jgi:hypothetical protein